MFCKSSCFEGGFCKKEDFWLHFGICVENFNESLMKRLLVIGNITCGETLLLDIFQTTPAEFSSSVQAVFANLWKLQFSFSLLSLCSSSFFSFDLCSDLSITMFVQSSTSILQHKYIRPVDSSEV